MLKMDYGDFYDLAKYGNTWWKGSYTEKEVACNAYDYFEEYMVTKQKMEPTPVMVDLCRLIETDLGREPSKIDLLAMDELLLAIREKM
jgi:hypothetical protein